MLDLLALALAALFTGAAAYINLAEQPARLALADEPLLAQWRIAYPCGLRMQVPLLLAATLCGAAAWWHDGDPLTLVGTLLIFASMPYTLLAIMPTNHRLEGDHPIAKTRPLIVRWGHLHAGRSVLAALATLLFLLAAR